MRSPAPFGVAPAVCAALLLAGATFAQETGVESLHSSLTDLVDPAAQVEKVASGFTFIEGPVWVPRDGGYLLFSDIPQNKVHRLQDGTVRVEIAEVTPDPSPSGGVGGSNGLMLAPNGDVILCEHGNRRVARLHRDGARSTVVERFEGKRLNSPNDIVFDRSGAAYFTDPSYGLPQQTVGKELDWNGVYRITLGDNGRARSIQLLEKGMSNPNGVGLSPDEKTLYVANSNITQRHWMKFPVQSDGSLGEGTVLFDATSSPRPGVPDGFTVDVQGNLWASGPGGILVISPEGQHLGTVLTPELPANAAFGGNDGSVLYMTARSSLYKIQTKTRGLVFAKREESGR